MSDNLPARRGELARQDEEIPSELREAILDATNRIAKALPPGVQLELRIDDYAALHYGTVLEQLEAHVSGKSLPAKLMLGRVEAKMTISGFAGIFVPQMGATEIRMTADAHIRDVDADGDFDTITCVGWHRDITRVW